MGKWECPNCRGSFPEPVMRCGESSCPWCGQAIDGSYEFEPQTISHIKEKQEVDQPRTVMDAFFGRNGDNE